MKISHRNPRNFFSFLELKALTIQQAGRFRPIRLYVQSPTIWRIVLLLFSMMLTAATRCVLTYSLRFDPEPKHRGFAIVAANESYSSLPQVTYGYADGNAFMTTSATPEGC